MKVRVEVKMEVENRKLISIKDKDARKETLRGAGEKRGRGSEIRGKRAEEKRGRGAPGGTQL